MPTTYTDQQILDQLRAAYMAIAIRGAASYQVSGRTFTALNLPDLQAAIVWFEQRVDSAGQPGIGGGTLLVESGDAV